MVWKCKVVYKPIDDLKRYERNPRLNSEAVPFLKNSIKKFNFKVPMVIDKDNVIVCGDTRYLAAKALGMKEVPCVIADDLSPDEVKAFRLADNKVAEIAGWDFDDLNLELSDLGDSFDMSGFGFLPIEDGDLISDTPADDIDDDDDGGGSGSAPKCKTCIDDDPDVPEPPTGGCSIKAGDIICLGRHWLMCGDSQNGESIGKLMGASGTRVKADIAFTSPPYNSTHAHTGRPQDRDKYLNDTDARTDDEYASFLKQGVDVMLDNAEEVFLNIGIVQGSKRAVASLLTERSGLFKDVIYWRKTNPVPVIAKNTISTAVEPIFAFGHNGTRTFKHDPGIWYGVIDGSVACNNRYADIHHATFPIYLPKEVVTHFTDEGATVLDPYGGTGTTLMACEETGRTCYTCDIEPAYCSVIVSRYAEAYGKDGVFLCRDGKKVPYDKFME